MRRPRAVPRLSAAPALQPPPPPAGSGRWRRFWWSGCAGAAGCRSPSGAGRATRRPVPSQRGATFGYGSFRPAAAGAAARSRRLRASATSRPECRPRRDARIPRPRAGPAGRSTLAPLARFRLAHLFLDRHSFPTAASGRATGLAAALVRGPQPGGPVATRPGLAWHAARAKPACIGAGRETGYDSR